RSTRCGSAAWPPPPATTPPGASPCTSSCLASPCPPAKPRPRGKRGPGEPRHDLHGLHPAAPARPRRLAAGGPTRRGSSPGARREDAGAPMIGMQSLSEEQIGREQLAVTRAVETPKESYAEALSYLPEPDAFSLGPDEYLEQLRRIKRAVSVPVLGSLNGTTV